MLAVLNIGALELLVLAVVAVLLFGGDLPAALRKAGRVTARLRATVHDLSRAVYAEDDGPDAPRPARPPIPPPEDNGPGSPPAGPPAPAPPADDATTRPPG